MLVSNRLAYTLVVDKSSFGKDEAALNDAIWQLIQLCQEQGVTWNDTLPMTTGSSPQLTSKSLNESFREWTTTSCPRTAAARKCWPPCGSSTRSMTAIPTRRRV